MKRSCDNIHQFESLVLYIFTEVFQKEKVYPDILLRDYARLILERFIYENPDKGDPFDVERIRPPYSSDPIPEVEAVDYNDEKYHEKFGYESFIIGYDQGYEDALEGNDSLEDFGGALTWHNVSIDEGEIEETDMKPKRRTRDLPRTWQPLVFL